MRWRESSCARRRPASSRDWRHGPSAGRGPAMPPAPCSSPPAWRSGWPGCRPGGAPRATTRPSPRTLVADARDRRLGRLAAGDELAQQRVEARRPLEHRNVARVLEDLLARVGADQALVLLGVGHRHQHVVATPHDQGRGLDLRQLVAERVVGQPLHGRHEPGLAGTLDELPGQRIGQLLRVADHRLQRHAAQPGPADHRLRASAGAGRGHRPRAADGEQRLAAQVLDREADGRHQHELFHPGGKRDRELGGDEAAHRVADDDRAFDPERVAQRVDRLRVSPDGDPLGRHRRAAETGQVRHDHPVGAHERRDVQQPVLPEPGQAVDEHDGRPVAARVDHLQLAVRHPDGARQRRPVDLHPGGVVPVGVGVVGARAEQAVRRHVAHQLGEQAHAATVSAPVPKPADRPQLPAAPEHRAYLPAIEPERQVTDWGRSERVEALVDKTLYDFAYHYWFRCEVEGIENVPSTGGALLVSNHAGALPPDATMIAKAIKEEHQRPRRVHLTVEHFFKGYPFFSMLVAKIGGVPAHPANVHRLLYDEEELVLVFPEGRKGSEKLYKDRYRLRRFGRGGFVEAAMRARAPIVPVAVVGAEEAAPIFAHITVLQKLTGFLYFPLTPTFPHFGIPGMFGYLPAKFHIRFLEPIATDQWGDEPWQDSALVQTVAEEVRALIQEELYDMLAHRRSVWFG